MRSTAININASDTRHNEFLACLKEVRDSKEVGGDSLEIKHDLRVIQDVKTRWNSTTLMLIRFRTLRPAIERYIARRQLLWLGLSHQEWEQVSYLIGLTKPLALCTKMIGKSKGPTLHMAFIVYDIIFDGLETAERRLKKKTAPWKRQLLQAVGAATSKLSKYYAETREQFGDRYGMAILLYPSVKEAYWTTGGWTEEDVDHYWGVLEQTWKRRYARKESFAQNVQQAPRSTPAVVQPFSLDGFVNRHATARTRPGLSHEVEKRVSEFARYKQEGMYLL